MYVYAIYSRFRIGTILSIRKHGYEFITTLSLSSLMSPFSLSCPSLFSSTFRHLWCLRSTSCNYFAISDLTTQLLIYQLRKVCFFSSRFINWFQLLDMGTSASFMIRLTGLLLPTPFRNSLVPAFIESFSYLSNTTVGSCTWPSHN